VGLPPEGGASSEREAGSNRPQFTIERSGPIDFLNAEVRHAAFGAALRFHQARRTSRTESMCELHAGAERQVTIRAQPAVSIADATTVAADRHQRRHVTQAPERALKDRLFLASGGCAAHQP